MATKFKFRPSDEQFIPLTVNDEELQAGREVLYMDETGKQHKAVLTRVHRDSVHLIIKADKEKEIHSKVVFSEEPLPNTFQLA